MRTNKPLPVFVEKRLDEIRKEKDIIFGYIPSKQNPADFATRGLAISEVIESDQCWHGPIWLKQDESNWRSWNLPDISSAEIKQLLDQAKQGPRFLQDTKACISAFSIDESKYSSLRKLQHFV